VKAFNFTESRVGGLPPPAKGEATYRDTAVRGLELRVLASGTKSYGVRFRLGGRGSPQRRLTLGAAGEVRLDEARKAAIKALAEVRHGGDPPPSERRRSRRASKRGRRRRSLNWSICTRPTSALAAWCPPPTGQRC
jgi:hypothetical protein